MKIHLHSRQGLYTVVDYGRDSITVRTKHRTIGVPCSDFKSFAGGMWAEATEEEQRLFLSVVNPQMLEKTLLDEASIKALANMIDVQDRVKQKVSTLFPEEEEQSPIDNLDYKKWYEEEKARSKELSKKMIDIARQVYSQDIDFSKLQFTKGIKFIIQVDHDEAHCRFCFDPYGFVDNYHSSISEIYRSNKWYTKNGGWLKIMGNDVILYGKSGDYGVYDDIVAIEGASRIFKGKKIHSFAGRSWDEELDNMFDDLPF